MLGIRIAAIHILLHFHNNSMREVVPFYRRESFGYTTTPTQQIFTKYQITRHFDSANYSGSFRLVRELSQAEAMLSQTVFQEQPDPNCQQPLLSTPPPKKANWGQTEKSLTTWYKSFDAETRIYADPGPGCTYKADIVKAQEKDWWSGRIIDSLEAGQLTPFGPKLFHHFLLPFLAGTNPHFNYFCVLMDCWIEFI